MRSSQLRASIGSLVLLLTVGVGAGYIALTSPSSAKTTDGGGQVSGKQQATKCRSHRPHCRRTGALPVPLPSPLPTLAPSPSPTPSPTSSPTRTPSPSPTSSPTPTPSPSPTSSPSSGAPMFGGTVYRDNGETYEQAYQRVQDAYDGLDAIRYFFPGMPSDWSTLNQRVHNTPLVVSFKADPAAVIAGRHDAFFRNWFAEAPTTRVTHWTYWHEPENDSVDKAQYRAAWQHLAGLADQAGNPKLRSTLILMCWTLSPHSGRDWHDYYPGGGSIDVLGFDCYNTGRRNGVYRAPSDILAPVKAAAASANKPWGVAEFGTTVVESDGGRQGRADWLHGMASYIADNGGVFGTYFDSYVGFDYRLHDDISRNAWRQIVNAS